VRDGCRPTRARRGPAPQPPTTRPLKGERIAILGAPRDGALALWLAFARVRVLASVGVTTTMLVVSNDQPYGKFAHVGPEWRGADELGGSSIRIIGDDEVRSNVAARLAANGPETGVAPADSPASA
jgi:DNA polymerase-3 subunit epsilon